MKVGNFKPRPSPAPARFALAEAELARINFHRDHNRGDEQEPPVDIAFGDKAYKRCETIRFWKYRGALDEQVLDQLPSRFWGQVYMQKLYEEFNDVHMVIKKGDIIEYYTWHCLRWYNSRLISRTRCGNITESVPTVGREYKAIIYNGDRRAFRDEKRQNLVQPVEMPRKDPAPPAMAERWVRRTKDKFNVSDPDGFFEVDLRGVQRWCPDGFIPDV